MPLIRKSSCSIRATDRVSATRLSPSTFTLHLARDLQTRAASCANSHRAGWDRGSRSRDGMVSQRFVRWGLELLFHAFPLRIHKYTCEHLAQRYSAHIISLASLLLAPTHTMTSPNQRLFIPPEACPQRPAGSAAPCPSHPRSL